MRSNQQDLLATMTASLTAKLQLALTLTGGDLRAAVEMVKGQTTAGPKVWEAVLARLTPSTAPGAGESWGDAPDSCGMEGSETDVVGGL